MKNFIKYPFALVLLSAGAFTSDAKAIRYVVYDPLFDASWADDLLDLHRQSVELFRQRSLEYGLPKEDREALKAASDKLAKIKQDVTEGDKQVTITFSGFEGLDKKEMLKNAEIIVKDSELLGTITLKEGKVEFAIDQRGVQMTRRVEISHEEKNKRMVSQSLATEGYGFKKLVDLATAKSKAEDNMLTITIEKKKEKTLPIE